MREHDILPTGGPGGAVGDGGAPAPRPDYYLHSEGIHVSATPCTIMTILGSCVAVCLWEPASGIGGMNHFLLPHGREAEARVGRFGGTAIRRLIERVEALGCRRRALRAKVFGGACINGLRVSDGFNLGRANVEVAFATLELEGIPVAGHDVGGGAGRKLLFHTGNGTAWVKPIGEGADGTRR